jgi:hypothetical protein
LLDQPTFIKGGKVDRFLKCERSVRKIGTGSDAIFRIGLGLGRSAFRAAITATPASGMPSPNRPSPSWTTLATRVWVNISFTASSVHTYVVNGSAPELFLVEFIINEWFICREPASAAPSMWREIIALYP